jgi:hypothetical protein
MAAGHARQAFPGLSVVTALHQIGDPDPDIVRCEFPGAQVLRGTAGGWVAVWKEHTYTGKSPEGLVSKMRTGQHAPAREDSTGATA